MLTKTNVSSVANYLRGNTDRLIFSNLKMKNKISTLPPLEKFLRTLMNDSAFSLSHFVTFVLSLITNCLFLSVILISVAK